MKFSTILKDLMSELNLNQTQFAKKIGVKQAQVSEWLKEKAKPGYDTLKMMAICLNVSADYLLGLENEDGTKNYNVSIHDFHHSTINFK